MNIPFFRKQNRSAEEDLYPLAWDETSLGEENLAQWTEPIISAVPATVDEHLVKAQFGQTALVTIDEHPQLPSLLTEARSNPNFKRIRVPRNPRSALNEFHELEAMDLTFFLLDNQINQDAVRWLMRLKQMGLPLVVLLHRPTAKFAKAQTIKMASHQLGLQIVPIMAEKLDESRQALLQAVLELNPTMALALAAQVPSFRAPLDNLLLERAMQESILASAQAKSTSLETVQKRFVREIAASHGIIGQKYQEQISSLETLCKLVNFYSPTLLKTIPVKNSQCRIRFQNAVSTLLLGYAIRVYFGARPPAIRRELLPNVWRLYRASAKSLSE